MTSPAPRNRRRVLLVTSLVVGTVASLSLMVASTWVPFLDWAAVIIALVAGFLATWAALVEFREWRARAVAEAAAERAAERSRTQAFHASQREVLTTVDARIQAVAGALEETRADLESTREELVTTKVSLGEAQQQVSRLRGDNEALRRENGELRAENGGLLAQLEAVRQVGEEAADVVELPRRRSTADGEAWEDVDVPTVVDLDLQRLSQPFVAEVQARHAN